MATEAPERNQLKCLGMGLLMLVLKRLQSRTDIEMLVHKRCNSCTQSHAIPQAKRRDFIGDCMSGAFC